MPTSEPTPNHSGWRHEFSAFLQQLELKVERGAIEYGDKSFDLPANRTISELQAELLDICGWGFILWVRMERLRQALEAKEQK